MNILVTTNSYFFDSSAISVEEPLFLNPDGTRKVFPIGWEGKGRYIPGSLRLYRASDNTLIDKSIYHEMDNRVSFEFNTAPAAGNYTDIKVKYLVDPVDYAFSQGTSDSPYPGEEYFLFPNWNNAQGIGAAFWVGKYAASRADATTTSQGSSTTPVSKKGKCSWVNTRWDAQVAACPTKGTGFHCIRNREWVSIALWCDKMGLQVYGNINGYNTGGTNIDMRGIGTDITSAMSDASDANHKILTGMGPDNFRHNGKSGGISDLAGNVWEAVDGLQLRNGVPYILSPDNSTYVALAASDISSTMLTNATINYLNMNTNDLLNEGLPVNSAGYTVQVNKASMWQNRSGTRICYRGGNCAYGSGAGVWALALNNDVSNSHWSAGFRLARALL